MLVLQLSECRVTRNLTGWPICGHIPGTTSMIPPFACLSRSSIAGLVACGMTTFTSLHDIYKELTRIAHSHSKTVPTG